MAHIIVGQDPCKFQKLMPVILTCEGFSEVRENWRTLAALLELSPGQIDDIADKHKKPLPIVYNMIVKWANKYSDNATLGVLVIALDTADYTVIGDAIRKKWNFSNSPVAVVSNNEDDHSASAELIPLAVEVVRPDDSGPIKGDYKLYPYSIGFALVINITEFDHWDPVTNAATGNRLGAKVDTKYMKDLWTQLGYKVFAFEGRFTKDVLTARVNNFLNEFKKLKPPMSCVVFIGTHGGEGRLQMSDLEMIDLYDDLVFKFNNAPVLKYQPKIFILQACQNFPSTPPDPAHYKKLQDTIVCYPTTPGDPANRSVYTGSCYIRTVTEVFMREAHQKELQEMLKEVNAKMKLDAVPAGNSIQVPYYREFNMKPLYFNI